MENFNFVTIKRGTFGNKGDLIEPGTIKLNNGDFVLAKDVAERLGPIVSTTKSGANIRVAIDFDPNRSAIKLSADVNNGFTFMRKHTINGLSAARCSLGSRLKKEGIPTGVYREVSPNSLIFVHSPF